MMPPRLPVPLYVFCRFLVLLWLLVLTGLVFSNLATTARMQADISESGQDAHVLLLEETVAGLAGQLAVLQEWPGEHQNHLVEMQRELHERIRILSDNLAGLAKQSEFQALQVQLQQLQHDVQALQAAPVVKPAAPAGVTSSGGGKNRAAGQAGTIVRPPFKVLGVELRGGERLLSVLPAGEASVTSVILLHAGQHIGQWRLEVIEERHAVFKVGARTHRIAIAQ